MMGMEELLTTAQVGLVLKMRPESVVRKIRLGQIPAVKVGKQWLIRKEAVDAILEPAAPQGH